MMKGARWRRAQKGRSFSQWKTTPLRNGPTGRDHIILERLEIVADCVFFSAGISGVDTATNASVVGGKCCCGATLFMSGRGGEGIFPVLVRYRAIFIGK